MSTLQCTWYLYQMFSLERSCLEFWFILPFLRPTCCQAFRCLSLSRVSLSLLPHPTSISLNYFCKGIKHRSGISRPQGSLQVTCQERVLAGVALRSLGICETLRGTTSAENLGCDRMITYSSLRSIRPSNLNRNHQRPDFHRDEWYQLCPSREPLLLVG